MIIERPTRAIAAHGSAYLHDCLAAAIHRTGGVMRFDTQSAAYKALAAKYPDIHPQMLSDVLDTPRAPGTSCGLGDTVANLLKRIGIKQGNCRCRKRQEMLNRVFPYRRSSKRPPSRV